MRGRAACYQSGGNVIILVHFVVVDFKIVAVAAAAEVNTAAAVKTTRDLVVIGILYIEIWEGLLWRGLDCFLSTRP